VGFSNFAAMKREFSQASNPVCRNEHDTAASSNPQAPEIRRLKQETQVLELIAYSLLSVVGVFSLFAALGVDFGTSFDKAPLLLLFTCCSALTYMTRKNKLARMEAEASASKTGTDREG
jgi:hypothetical protein